MEKTATNARRFLESRSITPQQINPALFAKMAVDVDLDFVELLRYIGYLAMGGQGLGPAPIGEEISGGIVP